MTCSRKQPSVAFWATVLVVVLPQLDAAYVIGGRAFAPGDRHDLVGGNKQEFGLRVNELADQPRASHAVNFYLFTSDPFHRDPRSFKGGLPQLRRDRNREPGGHAFQPPFKGGPPMPLLTNT